jgi:hypothetical protein
MSPLPICPSPDSSTANSEYFSGRLTPKMFITTKAFSSMTSSPLSTHSFENDYPSPANNIPSSSSASSQLSKDQEGMEVASTSGDSGVCDTNSDVGSTCELASNDVQNDSMLKEALSKDRDEMIIEEEIVVTPSNLPMT